MKRNITFTICTMLAVVIIGWAIRTTAQEPAPTTQLLSYSGILRAVDPVARTIAVDGSAVPQKFSVSVDAEIIVKDKPKGALADLQIGDGIRVKYIDENGVHVAHQISLLSLKAP